MSPIEPPSFDPLVNIAQAGFSFSSSVLPFIAVGILLICSALVSGAEAAFFSLSPKDKEDLRNDPNKSSKLVLDLLTRPKELLATILIANNFVNVGTVIISTTIVDSFFVGTNNNETLRLIIEIFAITLLLLLIGEVIPKIYATKNAARFARGMALPLKILNNLPPFSWLKSFLVKGSNIISKRAKRKGFKIS